MNRKELEDKLEKMTEEEFKDFIRKFGGGHTTKEGIVRVFIDDPKRE